VKILFWGSFALDSNRITTCLSNGPGNSPPLSARFLANLRIAIIDVYFSIFPDKTDIARLPPLLGAINAKSY
jgi:hypothetical protein